MHELSYLNLDLLIERAEPDYRVRVLASPAGETGSVSFHVPFSDLEIENFLLRIGRPRRDVRRINTPQVAAIKDFGGRLFETVFTPELRRNLDSSISHADAVDAGLRIRLRLSGCPELSELPWEYLFDREHNRFLSLSDRTPLVRYLEVSDPVRVLPVTLPLRILVVIASPLGFQQLDGEREWSNVTASLNELVQRGRVEVKRLVEPTPSALARQLRRETYHVFHFIGHGGFDSTRKDGVLAMEDDHGYARLVSGEDLGTLLHDHRSLRLAVLNACEGARGDRADPFSGSAQSLVQQGVPAVLAMQFEITDEAAITFGHVLYEAVADGYPLDAATAEARKAIYADGNATEWATPVLYLRAPDGRIFDVQDRPQPAFPPSSDRPEDETDPPAPRQAEERPQREAEQKAKQEAEERPNGVAPARAGAAAGTRSRRPTWLPVAIGVAVLGLLGFGILGLRPVLGGGGTDPSPAPSGSGRAGTPVVTSPTNTPSTVRESATSAPPGPPELTGPKNLTGKERVLLDRIPQFFVGGGSCSRMTAPDDRNIRPEEAAANLECRYPGGTAIVYSMFQSDEVMNRFFDARLQRRNLSSGEGSFGTVPNWQLNHCGDSDRGTGRIYGNRNTDPDVDAIRVEIGWVRDGFQTYAYAFRPKDDFADLFTWWRAAYGPVDSSPC